MKTFFLHRGPVAEILKIQILRHIVRIQTVGDEFGLQHDDIAYGILNGINIGPVACHKPDRPVTAARALFHGHDAGHGRHTVYDFLKIHPSLSPLAAFFGFRGYSRGSDAGCGIRIPSAPAPVFCFFPGNHYIMNPFR